MGFNREDLAKKMDARYLVESTYEWRKWSGEIPFLKFKSKWEVKVIPPFGGAIARFVVKFNDKTVSVYLDCYDELGYFGEPHWEIYPNFEEDNERFPIYETDELLEAIEKSLTECQEELDNNEQ